MVRIGVINGNCGSGTLALSDLKNMDYRVPNAPRALESFRA
jgi:hypothetical protein